jgi:TetR/AcrR family transcriptional repressor of nem operon
MARPRKSDHTRQLLLTTGSQMLTEHGYHGTGIKQVLDAVGVPKGSFYNFFPSKEAFVAGIIYQYGEQATEDFRVALAGHEQDPAVVQVWLAFHNKVRNKQAAGESCACLLGAMAAEIAEASPLCNEALSTVEGRWLDTLEILVRNAQQQGDLRDDIPARELASLVFNCWQGSLLQYRVTGDIETLLSQLKTLILTMATEQGKTTLSQAENTET